MRHVQGLSPEQVEDLLTFRIAEDDPKAQQELKEARGELDKQISRIKADKRTLTMPLNRRQWWQRSWRCQQCGQRLTKKRDSHRFDPQGDCPRCGLTQRFI